MNAANDKACTLARVNQTAHLSVWGAAQLAITKEEVASGEESEARGYQTGAAASDGDEDGGNLILSIGIFFNHQLWSILSKNNYVR